MRRKITMQKLQNSKPTKRGQKKNARNDKEKENKEQEGGKCNTKTAEPTAEPTKHGQKKNARNNKEKENKEQKEENAIQRKQQAIKTLPERKLKERRKKQK